MSFIKFVGILCLCAIFLAGGAHKLAEPAAIGNVIKASPSVQMVLKMAVPDLKIKEAEWTLIGQAVGGMEAGFAFFIVVGIARRFFAFLLSVFVIAVTVLMHVDLTKPQPDTLLANETEMIMVLKNVAILGGLLILVGSHGHCKPAKAAPVASGKKKQ